MFNNFYNNKKVLVTGNTGFKGSWLSLWLNQMGAEVYGVSDMVPTHPSLFEISGLENKTQHTFEDIRNLDSLSKIISEIAPDIIFHLAAQPIVKLSYDDPIDTFSTNVMGTAHMLEAARKLKNECLFISITSDKCYDNVEWEWGYREDDALGGKDPYSASKAGAEIAIKTYFESFFSKKDSHLKLCSVRAGNVIGGGDWAANRLIPDIYRAWSKNEDVHIRSPYATRPWQHVLEPLSGYLNLAENLSRNEKLNGLAFNFGPNASQNHSVLEVLNELKKYWTKGGDKELFTIQENADFHEAGLLKLNCDRALHYLKWNPTLEFDSTLAMTAKWYDHFYNGDQDQMLAFTLESDKPLFRTCSEKENSMDRVDQMQGIRLTPLKIIEGEDGQVMHALKKSEDSFSKFGEAYFSTVNKGAIKGWKKHTQMHSNLIVPQGDVQFVFYDDREQSNTKNCFFSVNLSPNNYQRLSVEAGLWMAFKGLGEGINMVLNAASIEHDPNEAINDPIQSSEIAYPL